MAALDEIDLRILRFLVDDARRPFSDIAERVGLSPPAVSDRVARLRDHGIIRRFTVDIDRSALSEGTPVLLTIDVNPARVEDIGGSVSSIDGVETVYTTADARLVVHAHAPTHEITDWLFETVDPTMIRRLDVSILSGVERDSGILDTAAFSLTCAECGNEVGPEGTTVDLEGEIKPFCCRSCESLYLDRYQTFAESTNG